MSIFIFALFLSPSGTLHHFSRVCAFLGLCVYECMCASATSLFRMSDNDFMFKTNLKNARVSTLYMV